MKKDDIIVVLLKGEWKEVCFLRHALGKKLREVEARYSFVSSSTSSSSSSISPSTHQELCSLLSQLKKTKQKLQKLKERELPIPLPHDPTTAPPPSPFSFSSPSPSSSLPSSTQSFLSLSLEDREEVGEMMKVLFDLYVQIRGVMGDNVVL